MRTHIIKVYLILFTALSGCSKSEFLDKRSSNSLTLPTRLDDFRRILDNTNIFNYTGGLSQLSSDDYIMDIAAYQAGTATQRNAYIWAKDLYEGELPNTDWNNIYRSIYYANAVLDGLEKNFPEHPDHINEVKGWALFARAFAYYDLVRNFCPAYDESTADIDLGIPIRIKSDVDYIQQRSSLKESIDFILKDLLVAESMLPANRPAANLNRPSKIAVQALLARIFLDLRKYVQAEEHASKCLAMYNNLTDYNLISKTSLNPFSINNEELIYIASQLPSYSNFTAASAAATGAKVDPLLIATYSDNDLRKVLFFSKQVNNSYTKKNGYYGFGSSYPFTGLATDEVFLIKSECLVRMNRPAEALEALNHLLKKRWDANATSPPRPFVQVGGTALEDILPIILLERRKELVWRGLRWHDLKRLSKEGRSIILQRNVDGKSYTLPPNDSRYVFPIPDDEIVLSGITQNPR